MFPDRTKYSEIRPADFSTAYRSITSVQNQIKQDARFDDKCRKNYELRQRFTIFGNSLAIAQ